MGVEERRTQTSPTPAGWPGAVNAWRVRPGLWRMGRAEWLNGPGWAAMEADGVGTVVDIRTPREVGRRTTDGPEAPVPSGIRRLSLPVEDADEASFWARNDPYPHHPRHYPDAVTTFSARVAATLRGTLEAWRDGGVVVHCSAGRDRTGMLTALLLQLPEIPGGPADWPEQRAVYEAGVRGINEYRRTATVPHPFERYIEPEDLRTEVHGRLEALKEFLAQWPGRQVEELLRTGAVPLEPRNQRLRTNSRE